MTQRDDQLLSMTYIRSTPEKVFAAVTKPEDRAALLGPRERL